MRVSWSRLAAEDLQRICDYVGEHNPHAATAIARRIYEGCASLSEFPNRHPRSRIAGNRDMHFPGLPYVAVYRVKEHEVEVIRIYHHAQQWL